MYTCHIGWCGAIWEWGNSGLCGAILYIIFSIIHPLRFTKIILHTVFSWYQAMLQPARIPNNGKKMIENECQNRVSRIAPRFLGVIFFMMM